MLRSVKLASVLTVSLLGAGAAHAATIDTFTFTSPQITGPLVASINASPVPASFVTGVSFTLNPITVTFEGNTVSGPVTFLSAGGASGGGATFSGPVLFSGPVSAPTFNLGTFALSGFTDIGDGPELVTGQLTISAAAPAVPEPLPLALTGTGILGLFEILRRRRSELRTGEINC
jgi:hypothetical protein